MNRKQRQFFMELADLMQEHCASVNIVKEWGEVTGVVWNVGGNTFECHTSLKPSTIRDMVEEQRRTNV